MELKKNERRAFALEDRVTIAHALHCVFVPGNTPDLETIKALNWILRRYGMKKMSQATRKIPVGIWRAVYSIFGDELRESSDKRLHALLDGFDAENSTTAD